MSSILKALKKLENGAPEKSETLFWHPTKPAGKPVDRRSLGRFGAKKRFLLILTLLVIAFFIGLTLSLKMRPKAPDVATSIKSPVNGPVKTSQKWVVGTRQDSESLAPENNPVKIETSKTLKEKPTLFTKRSNSNRRTLMPNTHKNSGSVNTLSPSSKIISTQKSVPQNTPSERDAQQPESNTKPQWFASLPVKQTTESQLELQAIAWAEDPKSRLAVINGRVVREGESVDNIIVLHIDKDQIIFKKGMESWRQLF